MEKNIKTCINDFGKFIDFVESQRPVLSAKLGVFGKKDSFSLNMLTENKKSVNGPNYNQDQYPAINLMFDLALLGKLYYKANDEKGKSALIKTPRLEAYLALTEPEKYVFLLETYWTKYEFEEKYHRWLLIWSFYNFLFDIAESKPGSEITKDAKLGTERMFCEGALFLHHLCFFGMGKIEEIDGAKGTYEDSIRSFISNSLGVRVSEYLLSEALILWNRSDLSLVMKDYKKAVKKKNDKAFDVFRHILPGGIVVNTIENIKDADRNGVYSFKVSLSKILWRKVNLSVNHTLGDLHMIIQKAFEFDNDHLYAFYIGGSRRTGKPIYCADVEDGGAVAEETTIEELGLFKGQKLVYLFDFGDKWEFSVDLEGIDKEGPLPLRPVIIEVKGKAPEQYGDGW